MEDGEKNRKKEMDKRMARAEFLLKKCREILRREGVPVVEEISSPVINDRIRSRFGSCRRIGSKRSSNAEYIVEISGRLMECDDPAVETVLLHELLHTCPGCMNHGKKWKAYAEKLRQKYGYDIRPTARYEAFGLEDPGSKEPVRYRIVCKNCGMEIIRKRRCPLVENVDRYRCGKCGGKLEIR